MARDAGRGPGAVHMDAKVDSARFMSFYSRHVFPRLMDWAIGSPDQLRYRREALSEATGDVLELGFGTGLNLACYPESVDSVTGVDVESALATRVDRRIRDAPMPVSRYRLDAAALPFEDGRFDTAVTTWTLCSIGSVERALREVARVLRPGGHLLFMEHGRSDLPRLARWQDRLNPIQKVVACGCHLNRRIDALIRTAGYEILRLERFRMPDVPGVLGEVYRGVARPLSAGAPPFPSARDAS